MRNLADDRTGLRRATRHHRSTSPAVRLGVAHVIEAAGDIAALVRQRDLLVGCPVRRRVRSAPAEHWAGRIAVCLPQERKERLAVGVRTLGCAARRGADGAAVVAHPPGPDAALVEPQHIARLEYR